MDVINLGILAHVDAGKTTLTEGMLFQAGCIRKMGNVDDGTTVTDSMDLEKKRGMTIKSSVISFEWNHVKINLIDTPGHFDFLSQVESVLHVLDVVVLVIAAREGVQPQTRLFFRKLSELKIPTIIFINKLDRMGVDYEDLIKTIRTKLTDEILECQRYQGVGGKQVEIEDIPLDDEELRMKLLLSSETLLAKYDESREITTKEYETELIRLIRGGKLYPVLGGVALKNQGITSLMDMLTKIMADVKTQTDKLSAYVFKVDFDQKGQKRIFFRVFSGTVTVRQNVYIRNEESQKMLVRNLAYFENGKIISARSVGCGDVGIIYDEELLKVGTVIGGNHGDDSKVKLKEPLFHANIVAKDNHERYRLLNALNTLWQEDPQLKFEVSSMTEDIIISLYGPLQMEIMGEILKNRFGLNISFGPLTNIYKEHPTKEGYCSIRIGDWKNPYYAGVVFQVEPLPLGSGFQYENLVSYGYLEKPFQNAVMDGIRIALNEGTQGHEVIDVKITFLEADYDSVMGTPADFRKLVPIALKKALYDAAVEILEPWQNFIITVPADYEKSVLNDICKMKARITEYQYGETETCFIGKALLQDMMNYESRLNILTHGSAAVLQDFFKYLPMNESVEALMEKYK